MGRGWWRRLVKMKDADETKVGGGKLTAIHGTNRLRFSF